MIREYGEKLTRQKTKVTETPKPMWTIEDPRVQGAAGTNKVEYHDGPASKKWREFKMNNNALNSSRGILEEVRQEQYLAEREKK